MSNFPINPGSTGILSQNVRFCSGEHAVDDWKVTFVTGQKMIEALSNAPTLRGRFPVEL